MSAGTSIEWTHMPGFKPATWNPVRGCTRVSEGCRRCYAETMAARFSDPGQWGHRYASRDTGRWTGKVELIESQLDLPLKWRAPRCVFVNSTSDLFHEKLADDDIDRVFAVMTLCTNHRFLVLTKRPERMRAYIDRIPGHCGAMGIIKPRHWPISNIWLGVSVEDQATANERIPILLDTPAAIRFVSYEPALGPVDFSAFTNRLDWIIAGTESGRNPRPYGIHWFSAAKAQCEANGVPFFMKQLTDHCGRKLPMANWPASLRVRQFPDVN